MASDLDNEIQTTAEEMNLPLEYVAAVYADDETPGKEEPASGEASSPPAESGDASPATPPSEPVSEGDNIPDKLTERASAYGLDPTKFQSADALQEQIDAYDRQMLESVRQQQPQQQQQPPQQQPMTQQEFRQLQYNQQWMQQEQQAAAQQPQQGQQPQVPQFKFDLGDDDDYDPEVLEKMNAGLQKVAEFYQPYMDYLQQLGQTVQQQQEYIAQQHQAEQAQVIEKTNAAFDSAVDEIEHEAFGKGRFESLMPTQQAERQKLMETATSLVVAYNQRGIPVPEIPDLVQQSFRLAFAEESKKANQAELRERVVDRSKRRLGTGKSSNTNKHKTANGKVKPYQGKNPEKDPVLMAAFNDMMADQDFQ